MERSGRRITAYLPKAPRRYNGGVRLAALLLSLPLIACSGTPEPADAGTDAGDLDAGADAGVVELPCKTLTCNASETYCKLTPVGACALDAGACGQGEEPCVGAGGSGCTPDRTPSCEALEGCTSCACLIGKSPCGMGTIQTQCRAVGGRVTVECPYPE